MTRSIRNGIIGAAGLILFYFIVMGVSSRSWLATISQFRQLWYWIIILSVGFGLQIGLFVHLKKKINSVKTIVAASSATSAVSMVACCAHHLTDVLPIIGLSAAAVFLTQYQIPLVVLGILINGLGILYMLKQIRDVKNK